MAEAARQQPMTLEQFQSWEDGQLERHEFIDGEVFAMAGAEERHVVASMNLVFALRQHLAGQPCRPYISDMRLQIGQNIFYPDVMVSCSEADRARTLAKQEPILLVEVLSPSTAAYDRGEKFARYRQIDSLQEYALIDLDSRRCDVYRRGNAGLWVLHPFDAGSDLELASVGLTISAAELLAGVDG